MSEKIFTIKADDLKSHPEFHSFLGLPKEEIERYHATVDVHLLDREQVENDPAYKKLICCVAIHFNYNWLTCRRTNGPFGLNAGLSMGLYGSVESGNQVNLFLDESYQSSVHKLLEREIQISGKYHVRLAGILNDDSEDFGRKHFGLVYVAKLSQPGVEGCGKGIADISFSGTGELQMNKDLYDPWSRMLIDNIAAL